MTETGAGTDATLSGMAPLFDILTTLIAFSVIMLLLSLVVTALVQGLQSGLALRARNLRRGLGDLLAGALPEGTEADPGELARGVIDHPMLNPGKGIVWQRLGTTWITRDELERLLRDAKTLPGEARRLAVDWFDRFEANLSKRFLAQIRWITFGCALVVAVVFQVDAIQTLSRLSADAEARERIAAAAEPLLERAAEDLRELGDPRATLGEALAELEARFPEHEERIEEVSGESGDRSRVIEDLREVLGPGAEAEEIVDAFDEIVAEIRADRSRLAETTRENALAGAARLGIEPWPEGPGFYFDGWIPRVDNWIGVLLTSLLLSLGAPFWFNQLRNLVNLRDHLADLGRREEPSGED